MIQINPPPKRTDLMRTFKLTHLEDSVLLRDLAALVAQDRENTATLLAYLAEIDERRLYLPAGYPSMYAFCLGELHLSEDAAYKRIRAARAAREFRVLFTAVARGRLHLSAVCLLAPHLTAGNANELIEAATHKCRSEVERWLAQRFPQPEALRLDDGVFPVPSMRFIPMGADTEPASALEFAPARAEGSASTLELAPGRVEVPSPPTRVSPLSPERYTIQVTIPARTHEKLRYAQALLGHAVPSGDIASVLDRALDSLIGQLEKRKFAATSLPRRSRPTRTRRHIPAQVRRAVWARDQGQCTFVGENGHRCGDRRRLEFDHVDPVARGGQATVERMRLRCRAHNQFEAEKVFGTKFMRQKVARGSGGVRSAALDAGPGIANDGSRLAEDEQMRDVIAGLRALGLRSNEARRVAEATRVGHPVTLEERLRLALQAHRPKRLVAGGDTPSGGIVQPGGDIAGAPSSETHPASANP
jgi:5-methylcytosine-specific restriction endonuclease McrA